MVGFQPLNHNKQKCKMFPNDNQGLFLQVAPGSMAHQQAGLAGEVFRGGVGGGVPGGFTQETDRAASYMMLSVLLFVPFSLGKFEGKPNGVLNFQWHSGAVCLFFGNSKGNQTVSVTLNKGTSTVCVTQRPCFVFHVLPVNQR